MHWRAETDAFEDVAAWRNLSLDYLAGDRPESVIVGTVSADYFRLLRAPLAAGRWLSADDDLPGAPGTAVISHPFWMDRLGGGADAVGRTISLSGRVYVIVGVAAREFDVGDLRIPIGGAGDTTVDDAQLWVPLEDRRPRADGPAQYPARQQADPGVAAGMGPVPSATVSGRSAHGTTARFQHPRSTGQQNPLAPLGGERGQGGEGD